MEIKISLGEIMDKGVWSEFCEMTGTSEYAINEGLADSKDIITLSNEQAMKLKLIKGDIE